MMKTFKFVYGAMLGELVLKHADNLSKALQHKSMSAAEGQEVALMTVETLKRIRSGECFDMFWSKVDHFVSAHDVADAELPRRRRRPMRYDDGLSGGDFHEEPKQFYKQLYFEALDLVVNCIQSRFDQPGYQIYSSLETLLIKSCKGENSEDALKTVCEFYKDDFDEDLLRTQLQTFKVHYDCKVDKVTIFDLKTYFTSLSSGQASLISEVTRLMQLVLVMPATNATSERSFSALRRVKNYLRSTMLQERLNYLMLLHVHNHRADGLDLKSAVNNFIGESTHRSNIFSKY